MRKVSEIPDFFVAIKKEAPSELPLSLFIIIIQLPQVAYLIDIQIFSSFCVDRKKKQEMAAELAASPLRQSSPETTPKSLICYRRLPLSFAQPTPRHLSWQTCEAEVKTNFNPKKRIENAYTQPGRIVNPSERPESN